MHQVYCKTNVYCKTKNTSGRFCVFSPMFSQLNHIGNLVEETLWTNW